MTVAKKTIHLPMDRWIVHDIGLSKVCSCIYYKGTFIGNQQGVQEVAQFIVVTNLAQALCEIDTIFACANLPLTSRRNIEFYLR